MATDNVKRVGLVFKADGTTDFQKSLKLVNAELQNNYANLKLAQSRYDESTTSVQKLKDNINYLQKEYDGYSSKVSILTEKLATLSNAENKDEVAISNVKTQLAKAQAQQEKYKQSLEEANNKLKDQSTRLEDVKNKLEKTSNKIEEYGKKASIASGAVVALGTAGVAAFKEVDEGADLAIKATGMTGDAAKELEKNYKNVASTTKGAFTDIGSVLGEVNTRFGFVGKELEETTSKFLKFAEVNNADALTSVQKVARYMGDAGIESSQLSSVLDNLTVAAQASGISIDNLAEMCVSYGAPMRALGFDTKESIAIFSSWEKAGVNTSIAFSGMKTAIASWSASGKDAKKEFKKTLEEIAKCPSIASATTKAIEAFGKKAGPDLADAIKCGRFEYEEMLALIENSEGAMQSTYDTVFDGADAVAISTQNAKIVFSQLGEEIMTNSIPLFEKVSEILKNLSQWFDGLDDSTKSNIVTIGLIVAAAGPLIIMIGKVIGGVGSIIGLGSKIIGGSVTLFGKISSLMGLLSPTTLIIGAIVIAVIAAIALIIANFDKLKGGVSDGITFITDIFTNFDNFLSSVFATDFTEHLGILGEPINAMIANFQNFYESGKAIFQGIIDFIAGVFTGDWKRAWNGIQSIFKGVFNGLISIAKVPINSIISFLNILISGINLVIRGLNKIHLDIPDWVPKFGGKSIGINIPEMGKIAYLANGGDLLSGNAIVAEAGPELLMQNGNSTRVVPLSKNSSNTTQIIDYVKLAKEVFKEFANGKIKIDKKGFIRMIDERLGEIV